MVKIKVRFPESKKKQRKIADEVRHTAYECAEELWEAMLDVMDVRTARCFESALLRLLDRGDCDDVDDAVGVMRGLYALCDMAVPGKVEDYKTRPALLRMFVDEFMTETNEYLYDRGASEQYFEIDDQS